MNFVIVNWNKLNQRVRLREGEVHRGKNYDDREENIN